MAWNHLKYHLIGWFVIMSSISAFQRQVAKEYIAELNCPGVSLINGDVFHMQAEEHHIVKAILEAGKQLIGKPAYGG